MPIYTGLADENGDFIVPFSASYTSGQKVTVIAEKNGATKSIELFAPSEVVGGDSALKFSGALINFPDDCGDITISKLKNIQVYAFMSFPKLTGIEIKSDVETISANAFRFPNAPPVKFVRLHSNQLTSIGDTAFYAMTSCTELEINSVKSIGVQAFFNMNKVTNLSLPEGLLTVSSGAFYAWTSLKKAIFPSTLISLGPNSCYSWSNCDEIILNAVSPPAISADTFNGLKGACVFKVPAGSVSAYQSAANWSVYAARIQAI